MRKGTQYTVLHSKHYFFLTKCTFLPREHFSTISYKQNMWKKNIFSDGVLLASIESLSILEILETGQILG